MQKHMQHDEKPCNMHVTYVAGGDQAKKAKPGQGSGGESSRGLFKISILDRLNDYLENGHTRPGCVFSLAEDAHTFPRRSFHV